jgi:hypothetical protein
VHSAPALEQLSRVGGPALAQNAPDVGHLLGHRALTAALDHAVDLLRASASADVSADLAANADVIERLTQDLRTRHAAETQRAMSSEQWAAREQHDLVDTSCDPYATPQTKADFAAAAGGEHAGYLMYLVCHASRTTFEQFLQEPAEDRQFPRDR